MNTQEILRIVEKYHGEPGSLLSILTEIQNLYGYLPEEVLKLVASKTGRPLIDIYSLATYFDSFTLSPPREKTVREEKTFAAGNRAVEMKCRQCGTSLMDRDFFINDSPSVRITAAFGFEHGWLRISSVYDSSSFKSEYELPQTGQVNIFCPHCHAELFSPENCPDCGAPMLPKVVPGGKMIQVCSSLTCQNRDKKLDEIMSEFRELSSVGV